MARGVAEEGEVVFAGWSGVSKIGRLRRMGIDVEQVTWVNSFSGPYRAADPVV